MDEERTAMNRQIVIQAVRTLRETIPEKETLAGPIGPVSPVPDQQREAVNSLIRELEISEDVPSYP
jgi:hypothetical protein